MSDGRRELGELKPVHISKEMLEKIDAIENTEKAHHKVWTKEEDEILLKYWPIKKQSELCKVMGISANTARDRYRKLTSYGI